ncbi:MAG: hypothetical protein KF712_18600 [Akkermansiaceae bacterium]|nr:hypothetical protein [Akkermansiaceae bacterium]
MDVQESKKPVIFIPIKGGQAGINIRFIREWSFSKDRLELVVERSGGHSVHVETGEQALHCLRILKDFTG